MLEFVGTESLVDLPAEISHNTYFVASSELKCLRYFLLCVLCRKTFKILFQSCQTEKENFDAIKF